MTKTKKQNIFALSFFLLIIVLICIYLTRSDCLYGSSVDWQNQHYLIPEYFRNLFYDTGKLFPNFAFNLGAGENIYYLSYYGLFSPIIFISYLLPFVSMLNYIVYSSLILLYLSAVLFYFFLRKNKYSFKVSLICSVMLLCSGPLLFHSHRHIMFMNYVPFLILGLYGVDKYFHKGKSGLLMLSSFLIIMTSYYYSVGSLVVLFLYYTYLYLRNNEFEIKDYIINSFKIALRFIVSILLSMILLLPTFYVLLNSRGDGNSILKLVDLLKPNTTFSYLLYNAYSIGTTAITLIAIIYMLFIKRKENRFLGIILLLISIFPIFNYIFNGTLYIDSKSLIPFLPLVILITAEFLKTMFNGKINLFYVIIIGIICSILSKSLFITLDILGSILIIFVFKHTKKTRVVGAYLCLLCFITALIINNGDKLITKNQVDSSDNKALSRLMFNLYDRDTNLYRTENMVERYMDINSIYNMDQYQTSIYSSTLNKTYNDFYYNVFNNSIPYRTKSTMVSVNNPLFQILMGERYIIAKEEVPLNARLIKEQSGVKVYEKEDVLPIGYASSHILSTSEFNKLNYPNNTISLINNIIVDDVSSNSIVSDLKNTNLDFTVESIKDATFEKTSNGYKIVSTSKDGNIKLKLNTDVSNKIMYIRFKNDNIPTRKKNEITITINGNKNKLSSNKWKYYNSNTTFDYTLYDDSELNITFSKGTYYISNIEVYLLDYEDIANLNKNVDEFKFNMDKTKGDNIVGSIDVTEDGYFNMSIPYDKGFNIYVDGKKTEYKKTNISFIGFKIAAGHHDIKITYKAPFRNISTILSISGTILFILVIRYENKIKKA
jgi:uncharacterized membrane protein YfhO